MSNLDTSTEPASARPGFVAARLGGLPRAFWVLWAGPLVNRLGPMVEPFLAFYLTGMRGLSLAQTGLMMAVFGAGSVFSQMLGGYLADRVGRRATLAGGMLASGATMLALGYATEIPVLVAVIFLVGLSMDLYRPASGALIADIVRPADRARAYGLRFWAVNMGFAVATVLGGFLAEHGFIWLFWIDAITCVGFAVLIWRAVDEPPRNRADDEAGRGGFGTVLRDRVMVGYTLTGLAYCFVYLQAYTTLPLAMGRDHLSSAAYGTAIAINGVVIVIVQPLVVRWLSVHDHSRVLAVGMVLVGGGFGLYAVASTAPVYAAIVVVWTLGEIIVSSVAMAIVADLAPSHLRGRYQGVYGTAWSAAALTAPLVGTTLLGLGPLVLWPVCAALAIISAVGQLLLAPAIRRRTAL